MHGLSHCNVVRGLSLDPYAQTPYLIMEYVRGSSLRPLIEKRLLDVGPALDVLAQILTGLEHAHGHGVIHRDIKPENVLIDQRIGSLGFNAPGMVKLADFGMGRVAHTAATRPSSILFSGSVGGSGHPFAGTPGCAAPEVLEGAEADCLSDLYSCGVMLYEMLAGHRPVGNASLAGLTSPIARGLDALFRRAYAPRDQRFPSALAFLDAVRGLLATIRTAQVANEPSHRPSSPAQGMPEVDPSVAARAAEAEEARARVESARAQQRQAEARSRQADADREAAGARREAAAAERERQAAGRQWARAERLRAEAEAEHAKRAGRARRQRLKAEEGRARAAAVEMEGVRRRREADEQLRAADSRAALRRARASERADLLLRAERWGRWHSLPRRSQVAFGSSRGMARTSCSGCP